MPKHDTAWWYAYPPAAAAGAHGASMRTWRTVTSAVLPGQVVNVSASSVGSFVGLVIDSTGSGCVASP